VNTGISITKDSAALFTMGIDGNEMSPDRASSVDSIPNSISLQNSTHLDHRAKVDLASLDEIVGSGDEKHSSENEDIPVEGLGCEIDCCKNVSRGHMIWGEYVVCLRGLWGKKVRTKTRER